jgi:hypothetical protein
VSQADEERPLPPEQEAELLEALEAALRPTELEPRVNERLIELVLEDPLAPPSEEELVESARLRDALAHGTAHEAQAVLAALRAAAQPGGDDAAVERAVEGALREPRRRGSVLYAVFGGASAVLAAAALITLFIGTATQPASAPAAEYAKPRSTAPLFSERFETESTTARMDRIASVRSRDLRENRYASWGVR